jgi:hypothetical protein
MICSCGVEVAEHPASRCLDALVAERVMGWRTSVDAPAADRERWAQPIAVGWQWWNPNRFPCPFQSDLPTYSSSIAAAWEVVETVSHRWSRSFTLGAPHAKFSSPRYKLWFTRFGKASAYGETAPLAIVRAALLSVGEKKEEG